MKSYPGILTVFGLGLTLILTAGCGNDNNNSLAPFQPEIINETDTFQFQITDAVDVTTIVEYAWQNSGTQATINHSSVIDAGYASITILDAQQTEVYSSSLVASANEPTDAGTAGAWTIQVALMECSGTLNFRVETFTP
jgi:hypothetical protein